MNLGGKCTIPLDKLQIMYYNNKYSIPSSNAMKVKVTQVTNMVHTISSQNPRVLRLAI